MVAAIIAVGVVLAWLAIVVLVHVEHGWVGVSEATRLRLRLTVGVSKIQHAIGAALIPAIQKATVAMVEWHKSFARLAETLRDDDV